MALLALSDAAVAQSERRVNIGVSGRATYDSNLIRSGDIILVDGQPVRGSGEDMRFTPAVTVDILVPVSRQALFLSGSLGYDFHLNNQQLDRERLNLTGGVNLAVASCTGQISGTYSRQQSDIADLLITDELVRIDNTQETRALSANARCGDVVGLQPGFGFRHETTQNSGNERLTNDYTSNTYDAELAYVSPSLGSLALFSSFRDASYPNRVMGMREDGVKVYSAGGRFTREIGSRLTGTVSAGITRVDPKFPGTPGYSGGSYSADLTYRPSDRIQLGIAFSRDATVSNLLDISYSITETYSIDGEYALGQRYRILFGGSYTERGFRVSELTDPDLAGTGDKRYLGFVGLRYLMNDRISVDFDLARERRDFVGPQTIEGRLLDYKSTRFSVGASLVF